MEAVRRSAAAKPAVRRRVLVGLVVAATVAGGTSVSAAAPAPARPGAGDFAGTSAQGLPLVATVAPDGRTLTLLLRWRCGAKDRSVTTLRRADIAVDAGGAFRWAGQDSEPGPDGDEQRYAITVDGRAFDDGTVTGSFTAASSYYNGQLMTESTPCRAEDVPFSLRARPPLGDPVVALEAAPEQLALGAGRVWALGARGGNGTPVITGVDLTSTRPSVSVSLDGASFPLLSAGEGAGWVVSEDRRSRTVVTRIDGRTGARTRTPVAPTTEVQGIVAGAGGVWLRARDRVLRLDTTRGRVIRAFALTGGRSRCTNTGDEPGVITAGRGAVWVMSQCIGDDDGTTRTTTGFLWRIDPRTDRVKRFRLRRSYHSVAIGPGGLWALTSRGDGPVHLHRISPTTGRVLRDVTLDGKEIDPSGLAVARDAVWLTGGSENGGVRSDALLRVDLATRRLSTPVKLDGTATTPVTDASGTWIADSGTWTLIRSR